MVHHAHAPPQQWNNNNGIYYQRPAQVQQPPERPTLAKKPNPGRDQRAKAILQKFGVNKDNVDHVYFGVMGLTGAGKTTFISQCLNREVGIGHGLKSCTVEVEDYSFMHGDRLKVHLIDTPGFDDTTRDDTDVLRDIAGWLGTTYDKGIRLSGIIYLHNISSPRVTGSAMRNLFMFQKLIGKECFPSILLATTFWGNLDPKIGADRERQLIETGEFWGEMYQRGSQIVRHTHDRASALRILDILIKRRREVVTQIQREMNEEHRDLDETSAGEQLNADLIRMQKKHEKEMADLQSDMQEALAAQNQEAAAQIAQMQEKVAEKIAKAEEERESLRVDLERINREREEEMESYKAEIRAAVEKLKEKNEEYDALKDNYVSRSDLEAKNEEIEQLRNMIGSSVAALSRKQTGFWNDLGDILVEVGKGFITGLTFGAINLMD